MEIIADKRQMAVSIRSSLASALEKICRQSADLGLGANGLKILKEYDVHGTILKFPGKEAASLLIYCVDDCRKPEKALLFTPLPGGQGAPDWEVQMLKSKESARGLDAVCLGAFFASADFQATYGFKVGYLAGVCHKDSSKYAIENGMLRIANEFSQEAQKSASLSVCVIVH